MKNMKAQASVEFLLIIALLSVIFAIATVYFYDYQYSSGVTASQETYREVCYQISDEVDNALSMGAYYERSFYLPPGNYNVSLQNYEIQVNYPNGEVVCYTHVNNTKNLVIGKNTIIYNETGFYFN